MPHKYKTISSISNENRVFSQKSCESETENKIMWNIVAMVLPSQTHDKQYYSAKCFGIKWIRQNA